MGRLEREVAADIRRTKINKAIITAVAIAGVIAVGALAPNVFSILGRPRRYEKQRRYQLKTSVSRLTHRGYLEVTYVGGKGKLQLTPSGQRLAALMGEGTLKIKRPRRWDGKWRILVFDIPEQRKKVRAHLRSMLIGLGLKRLQQSVWVLPYDCEDLIMLLKADLRIVKELLYVIADKIENDLPLRKHFALPTEGTG